MTTVRIPPMLRAAVGGEREVTAEGSTVGEVLDHLSARFPGLEAQLRFANVYLDGEDIRTLDDRETPVRDGSTLILLPAMAGGSASPTRPGARPAEPASPEG